MIQAEAGRDREIRLATMYKEQKQELAKKSNHLAREAGQNLYTDQDGQDNKSQVGDDTQNGTDSIIFQPQEHQA